VGGGRKGRGGEGESRHSVGKREHNDNAGAKKYINLWLTMLTQKWHLDGGGVEVGCGEPEIVDILGVQKKTCAVSNLQCRFRALGVSRRSVAGDMWSSIAQGSKKKNLSRLYLACQLWGTGRAAAVRGGCHMSFNILMIPLLLLLRILLLLLILLLLRCLLLLLLLLLLLPRLLHFCMLRFVLILCILLRPLPLSTQTTQGVRAWACRGGASPPPPPPPAPSSPPPPPPPPPPIRTHAHHHPNTHPPTASSRDGVGLGTAASRLDSPAAALAM
jgi:hypothetical protein